MFWCAKIIPKWVIVSIALGPDGHLIRMLVIFLSYRNDQKRWLPRSFVGCHVLCLLSPSSPRSSPACLKADKTVIRWYGVGGSSTWIKASRCILRSSASRTTVLVKFRILPTWRWGLPQNWEVRKGGEGNRRSRCHRQLWCRWQQRQEGDTGTPWANQAVVSLQPPCHRQLVLCILGGGIED